MLLLSNYLHALRFWGLFSLPNNMKLRLQTIWVMVSKKYIVLKQYHLENQSEKKLTVLNLLQALFSAIISPLFRIIKCRQQICSFNKLFSDHVKSKFSVYISITPLWPNGHSGVIEIYTSNFNLTCSLHSLLKLYICYRHFII